MAYLSLTGLQYFYNGLKAKVMMLTGNQTVAGTKTFSNIPLCATTPSTGDSSSKLANTAFVQQEIQDLGNKFSATVNSNGHLIITIGD